MGKAIASQFHARELHPAGFYLLEEACEKFEEENERAPSRKEKERIQFQLAKKLYDYRVKTTKRIQARAQEGRAKFSGDYRHYQICDLAWDVSSESLPLSLLASGKLSLTSIREEVTEFEEKHGVSISKKTAGGTIKELDIPRLYEAHFSIVRPTITRILAEQTEKSNSLYPFLKYDARAKSNPKERLKADVVSNRAEMVVDGHGWRAKNTQLIRHCLMYTTTVGFVDQGWGIEKAIINEDDESVVVREGFQFINPHPTCVFYDDAHPIASLNYDNGVTYCGFWKAVKAYTVLDNPDYWNRDAIPFRSGVGSTAESLGKVNGLNYISPEAVKFTQVSADSNSLLCGGGRYDGIIKRFEKNDRQNMMGFYAAESRETPIIETHYYEKVVPRDIGLGKYPYPVWVRYTVLNDDVIVNLEILPSRPAAVMNYNVNDSRVKNASLIHDILPYEDQIKQLVGQMLWLMKLQSLVVVAINTDIVSDPEIRKEIRAHFSGEKFYSEVAKLEFSFKEVDKLLLAKSSSGGALKALETFTLNLTSEIATLSRTISFTQSMMERNLMISPQQQGQLVTKETNATEIASVDKTTSILSNHYSDGVDEFWAAAKVILYESMVALGSKQIEVPVVESYPKEIVEAAGFELIDYEGGNLQKGMTVRGDRKQLIGNYLFGSRDRSERAVNSEIATTMLQLMQYMMGSDLMLQKFGSDQIANALTEVFRMSGSPFKFEVLPEENQQVPNAQQLQEALSQVAQKLQELEANDAETEKILSTFQEIIAEMNPQVA
jgi:hypothetical protein